MSLRALSEATTQLLVSCGPVLCKTPDALPDDALMTIGRRFGPMVRFLVADLGPRVIAGMRQRSSGGHQLVAAWDRPRDPEARRELEDEVERLLGRSPDLVLELRKLMKQIREQSDASAQPGLQPSVDPLPPRALWWHLGEMLGPSGRDLEAQA